MAEKPEDLSLPASVVARIIKDALPDGVSVSKEARVAIGKAASVFILYCTACSNNLALQERRKTLAASDVLTALTDMEFDEFTPELKRFLEAYKRDQKGKRVAAADRRKQKAVIATTTTTTTTTTAAVTTDSPQNIDEDSQPTTSNMVAVTSSSNGVHNTSADVTSVQASSGGTSLTVVAQQVEESRDVGEREEEMMDTDNVVEQQPTDSDKI